MVKDVYMRMAGIPALGILIPFVSGIIDYELYNIFGLTAASLFFVAVSFTIWTGSSWVHNRLRPLFSGIYNPFGKISAVVSANAIYGMSIGGLAALTWYKISRDSFSWSTFYKFVAICALAVVVFTLLYEIIFLTRERELDSKLVKEMDRELTQAELIALTNEMDPHFLFNSLNAMNYLILNNASQAHLFNNHLAQVYKYFLLNKNRKLIPLEDELQFIGSYFFLLEIRYDQNVRLAITIPEHMREMLLPPCAIQILVENAIKHNQFSEKSPLDIEIKTNGQHLSVCNKVHLKSYSHNSTNTGLKNLSLRYKLLSQQEIIIEETTNSFTVKLPLIHQSKSISHDQSYYY